MTVTALAGPAPAAAGVGPGPVSGDLAAWFAGATGLLREAARGTGRITGVRTYDEVGFTRSRYGWVLATEGDRYVVTQVVALWGQADTRYPPQDAYVEPAASDPFTVGWLESWTAAALAPMGAYTQTLTGAGLDCDTHAVGVRVHTGPTGRACVLFPWVLGPAESPTPRNAYRHRADTAL